MESDGASGHQCRLVVEAHHGSSDDLASAEVDADDERLSPGADLDAGSGHRVLVVEETSAELVGSHGEVGLTHGHAVGDGDEVSQAVGVDGRLGGHLHVGGDGDTEGSLVSHGGHGHGGASDADLVADTAHLGVTPIGIEDKILKYYENYQSRGGFWTSIKKKDILKLKI